MSAQPPSDGARNPMQGRPVSRRSFVRSAAVATAAVPGALWLGRGGALRLPTEPVSSERSAAGVSAPGQAPVSGLDVAGTSIRPPSVPLVVTSPYLSTWLPATELPGTITEFWTGSPTPFTGLVRVDGQVYCWAGVPSGAGAALPTMQQTSLEVTATRSVFTLVGGGVSLTAEWLSHVEPGDVRHQSVPLTLLSIDVSSTDGRPHAVQVYADLTGQWLTAAASAPVTWQMAATSTGPLWTFQLANQQVLQQTADMADWGSMLWSAFDRSGAATTFQAGSAAAVQGRFISAGSLANSAGSGSQTAGGGFPTFALAQDLGTIDTGSGTVQLGIGQVRSPAVSYGYGPDASYGSGVSPHGQGGTPLASLWTRYWPSPAAMVEHFFAGGEGTQQRAMALDRQVQTAATHAFGAEYAALCVLALRQTYGTTELVVGPEGRPWVMLKEISSDGDSNTVDMLSPSSPLWLWLDPTYLTMAMEPVLDWTSSTYWQNATTWPDTPMWAQNHIDQKYCVHDLGFYPNAQGLVPNQGEQMPVDESAGMLVMGAAYARASSRQDAVAFLSRYQALWKQWAEFLMTQAPTPASQLSTDDFAGGGYARKAGSVNLGIAAITGLLAASQIAELLGDDASAAAWSQAAQSSLPRWVQLSLDPDGQHLDLDQGASGTWSTLYNAYYGLLIGASVVPESVADLQAAYYPTQLESYGLPLQTGTPTGKTGEMLFTAAWLASYGKPYPVVSDILGASVRYVNDTPSRVPYSDRYDPNTAVSAGPKAHPIGAVFAFLQLAAPPASPAPPVVSVTAGEAVVAAGATGTAPLTFTNVLPQPADVTYTASPPDGITVTPATGSVAVPPNGTTTVTLEVGVAPGTPPGISQVPVGFTTADQDGTFPSSPTSMTVAVPYPSLAAAFNNVGITDDSNHAPGNFDGAGNSYSAETLVNAGLSPGATVSSAGLDFTWPNVAPGEPDNVGLLGQAVSLSGTGSELGFIGAGTYSAEAFPGTVIYTDGTTTAYHLAFPDWFSTTATPGNQVLVTLPYLNRTNGKPLNPVSLFEASVPIDPSRTVAAVVLPNAGQATQMHVFALSIGTPS